MASVADVCSVTIDFKHAGLDYRVIHCNNSGNGSKPMARIYADIPEIAPLDNVKSYVSKIVGDKVIFEYDGKAHMVVIDSEKRYSYSDIEDLLEQFSEKGFSVTGYHIQELQATGIPLDILV